MSGHPIATLRHRSEGLLHLGSCCFGKRSSVAGYSRLCRKRFKDQYSECCAQELCILCYLLAWSFGSFSCKDRILIFQLNIGSGVRIHFDEINYHTTMKNNWYSLMTHHACFGPRVGQNLGAQTAPSEADPTRLAYFASAPHA